MAAILIVEDELVLAHQLAVGLRSNGHEARIAETADEALRSAREDLPDLVLLDLRLPDRSGLEVISELKAIDSGILVVLMTAFGGVRDAVEAMRRGASDYLSKPLDLGELRLLIDRLLGQQRQERELRYLRDRDHHNSGNPGYSSTDFAELLDKVARLCDPGVPAGNRPAILLCGEPGSGKGIVARGIHDMLGGGPFIEANCTALSPARIAAELFGVGQSGSSSGESRPGLLEAAQGGSLLLSEVSDLEPDLQERLLEVIKGKRVRRMGSSRERDLNVHILVTTHRDLDQALSDRRIRADLLQHLRAFAFDIAPLRKRPDELIALARHYAGTIGLSFDGHARTIGGDAEAQLLAYSWPGNIRELHNVLERAIILSPQESLDSEALARMLFAPHTQSPGPGRMLLPEAGVSLEEVERDLVQQALDQTRGNRSKASGLLGLTRDTLRYRIAKWGLDKES
ncbi:MAG: sigma-54-dependent Fis family transcriptional regulator [bacterium]|nr:sigma-54-dependent Fis family transcriptional regulator [bacterium]